MVLSIRIVPGGGVTTQQGRGLHNKARRVAFEENVSIQYSPREDPSVARGGLSCWTQRGWMPLSFQSGVICVQLLIPIG